MSPFDNILTDLGHLMRLPISRCYLYHILPSPHIALLFIADFYFYSNFLSMLLDKVSYPSSIVLPSP